jgi:preprotein translocase subunit YajC
MGLRAISAQEVSGATATNARMIGVSPLVLLVLLYYSVMRVQMKKALTFRKQILNLAKKA